MSFTVYIDTLLGTGSEGGGEVVWWLTLWPITLATRVRFPVVAVRRKSVRVSKVIFHLPPATLQP